MRRATPAAPGQRKRQREHRVAEADEREIGRELAHWDPWRWRVGRWTRSRATQSRRARFRQPGILPHRARPPGRARRSAPRASRLRCCRSRRRSRARARRSSVALSSSAPRRHARRHATRLRQLGEHVQVGDAGQAVGAERHVDVQRVERRRAAASRRRRRRCCADTRRASTPSAVSAREVVAVELHAVHDQRSRRSRKPRSARYSTGDTPGRLPVVGPDAQLLEQRARRRRCRAAATRPPRPTRRGARSSRRPGAHRHRRGSPGTAPATPNTARAAPG